jgi:hypothetical protein
MGLELQFQAVEWSVAEITSMANFFNSYRPSHRMFDRIPLMIVLLLSSALSADYQPIALSDPCVYAVQDYFDDVMSNFFPDGWGFPEIMAAEKKGTDGYYLRVVVRTKPKLSVTFVLWVKPAFARPKIISIDRGPGDGSKFTWKDHSTLTPKKQKAIEAALAAQTPFTGTMAEILLVRTHSWRGINNYIIFRDGTGVVWSVRVHENTAGKMTVSHCKNDKNA